MTSVSANVASAYGVDTSRRAHAYTSSDDAVIATTFSTFERSNDSATEPLATAARGRPDRG